MKKQRREHPERRIPCPFCGADAGEACVSRSSGESYEGVHSIRETAFYSAAGRALQAMRKKAAGPR